MPCQRNQPLQFPWHLGPDLEGRAPFQALGHLTHHGQAHREVEPVDQVLRLGIQVARELAHVLAAIGKKVTC